MSLSQAQESPRFLTIQRAAEYVSLSDDYIRRMISSGKLTALRPVKGRIVIDRDELDSVVRASTAAPRKGRGIRRS
jgi:excisionase family DNA binding protein